MAVKEIVEAIKQYDTIIIHRHIRPDPDALGSQAGLKLLIKAAYPDKHVFVTGTNDPRFTFLVKMDEVKDEQYREALVIVCDTANRPRIDDERYKLGRKLIKIDHHPEVDAYGDIQWVNPDASSVSEMIVDLYMYAKKAENWEMTAEAARLLFAGIVGDTGRFLFSSATEKTFQYASELVSYPFSRDELYGNLYKESSDITRLRGFILSNFKLSSSGMSTISLTKEILNEYNVSPDETSSLVSAIANVEGIIAWVFFIEEDDAIRVRFRSKGPEIHKIAEKYGGGGHPMASGATIATWQETEAIIQDMEELCQSWKKNVQTS